MVSRTVPEMIFAGSPFELVSGVVSACLRSVKSLMSGRFCVGAAMADCSWGSRSTALEKLLVAAGTWLACSGWISSCCLICWATSESCCSSACGLRIGSIGPVSVRGGGGGEPSVVSEMMRGVVVWSMELSVYGDTSGVIGEVGCGGRGVLRLRGSTVGRFGLREGILGRVSVSS